MSVTLSAQLETRLTGPRLILARGVWIVVVSLALGLYIFGIPSQIALRESLCSGSGCDYDQISPVDLQQLQQAGISLHAHAIYFVAVNTIFVLVFLIVAGIIFWRRSNEAIGLFTSLALATFGVGFNGALEPLGVHHPVLLLPAQLVDALGGASMGLLFLVFPNGRFVPRWSLLLAPIFVLHELLRLFAPRLLGADYTFPLQLGLIVCTQIYRYVRVSNAIERQQTKWALAGMSAGVVGFGGLITWAQLSLGGRPTGMAGLIGTTALYLFLMLIPLSIGMAILRSHLWDIDILIRRTLVYTALTGLLALAYFGSVLVLQGLVRLLTGQSQSQAVIVVSTLVIAALFVPLRARVQGFIDRRFYRRKYDTAQTLAAFGAAARNEVELGQLSESLISVVRETMQPASVELWLVRLP